MLPTDSDGENNTTHLMLKQRACFLTKAIWIVLAEILPDTRLNI